MMAEFGGFCFWHPYDTKYYLPTYGAIDMEDLPLSWELNNQLTEWVDYLDQNINNWGIDSTKHNFDMLGRTLWAEVQAELGEEYKVVYYSELEEKVIE